MSLSTFVTIAHGQHGKHGTHSISAQHHLGPIQPTQALRTDPSCMVEEFTSMLRCCPKPRRRTCQQLIRRGSSSSLTCDGIACPEKSISTRPSARRPCEAPSGGRTDAMGSACLLFLDTTSSQQWPGTNSRHLHVPTPGSLTRCQPASSPNAWSCGTGIPCLLMPP